MKYTALCLNGPNKGREIEVTENYTAEEEQAKKDKLKFEYGGIKYAGHCKVCRYAVPQDIASYITEVDGLGRISVNVFCKYCL